MLNLNRAIRVEKAIGRSLSELVKDAVASAAEYQFNEKRLTANTVTGAFVQLANRITNKHNKPIREAAKAKNAKPEGLFSNYDIIHGLFNPVENEGFSCRPDMTDLSTFGRNLSRIVGYEDTYSAEEVEDIICFMAEDCASRAGAEGKLSTLLELEESADAESVLDQIVQEQETVAATA